MLLLTLFPSDWTLGSSWVAGVAPPPWVHSVSLVAEAGGRWMGHAGDGVGSRWWGGTVPGHCSPGVLEEAWHTTSTHLCGAGLGCGWALGGVGGCWRWGTWRRDRALCKRSGRGSQRKCRGLEPSRGSPEQAVRLAGS